MNDDSICFDAASMVCMFIVALAISFFSYDLFVDLDELYWICEAITHPYESGLL